MLTLMRTARLVVLSVMLVVCAGDAYAAGSLSGRVTLGYGETYRGTDGAAVHRGVDVAMQAGTTVGSPTAGEVTFAGRIPSADGGSLLCVTVRDGEDAVTLSPLDRIDVDRGARVEAGTAIGTLAASGDISSGEPHLHLSLRRGGVYLDPSGLLGISDPQADVPGPLEDAGGSVTSVQAPSVGEAPSALVPAAIAGPALVIGGLDSGVVADTTPPQAAPYAGEPAPMVVPSCDNVYPAGTGPAAALAAPAPAAGMDPAVPTASAHSLYTPARTAPALGALSAVRTRLLSRFGAGRMAGGSDAGAASSRARTIDPAPEAPVPASGAALSASGGIGDVPAIGRLVRSAFTPGGLAAITAVVLSLSYLVSLRAFTRRVAAETPVSDRFGSMLQHLRAGDTLCGLTSCSGLLPSQSRGRLAQRR